MIQRCGVTPVVSLNRRAKVRGVYPADMLLVVYCAGPHCNGADRAAMAIARLGRPVKKMIGGITGWIDEGFELERARADASPSNYQ